MSAARRPPSASLDEVIDQMQWGDCILFKCRMPHTAVVRAVTLANFDHIAVVVVDRYGDLCLLESCVLGVRCFPLARRVKEYANHFADGITWRRLLVRRTKEATAACAEFVEAVDGKPYDYNPGKILFTLRRASGGGGGGGGGGASSARSPAPMNDGAPSPPSDGAKSSPYCAENAYYCSELVAALYQHCGIMQQGCRAASFWPADFQQGGVCERWLAQGISLAPEVSCSGQAGDLLPSPAAAAPHNTPAGIMANASAAVTQNLAAMFGAAGAVASAAWGATAVSLSAAEDKPPSRPPQRRDGPTESQFKSPTTPTPTTRQHDGNEDAPLKAMSSTRGARQPVDEWGEAVGSGLEALEASAEAKAWLASSGHEASVGSSEEASASQVAAIFS